MQEIGGSFARRFARLWLGLLLGLAAAATSLAIAANARAANDLYVDPFNAGEFTAGLPSDADSVRSRAILANANQYALTTWYDVVKNFDAQPGTYLSFSGKNEEEQIRPPASQAYALASALATGGYDAAATGVPATTARAIAVKLARSVAYRHRVNTAGGWGYGWQTAYWAALAGAAGWMLWGDLTATDREYVRKMVEFEANRFIGWAMPYWKDRSGAYNGSCGNTIAEESAWNARLMYLAPVMMPQHSRRSGWTYKAHELAIGAFANPNAIGSSSPLRGRPVNDWLEGTNVNADGSLVNHGFYHPDYMSTITESVSGGLTQALAGDPFPLESLHGMTLNYDALVDKQWWPAPSLPCPGGPAFVNPGGGNPTGTMYIDGSEAIHYPQGNDWGTTRRAHFMTLDTMVRAFGLDGAVAQKASYWEDYHADKALEMQERPLAGGGASDGSTYRGPAEGPTAEDSYSGREEWVAARAAEAWLTKWLDHQGALASTNAAAQIVSDDNDRNVTIAGSWTKGSPAINGPQVFGPSVRYKPAGSGSAYVRFSPRMTQTASYDVYAWWVAGASQATNTPFTINHASGTATVTKNQRVEGGKWVLLGTYSIGPGDYVQVSDNANGYVVADGILLHPN